jgi:hypothetical protein
MFALFREGDVEDRPRRLAVCSYITWRTISSTTDLDERDVRAIGATLEYWLACGQIEYRCRKIADALAVVSA